MQIDPEKVRRLLASFYLLATFITLFVGIFLIGYLKIQGNSPGMLPLIAFGIIFLALVFLFTYYFLKYPDSKYPDDNSDSDDDDDSDSRGGGLKFT